VCAWSFSVVLKVLPHIWHRNCGWLPKLGSLGIEMFGCGISLLGSGVSGEG